MTLCDGVTCALWDAPPSTVVPITRRALACVAHLKHVHSTQKSIRGPASADGGLQMVIGELEGEAGAVRRTRRVVVAWCGSTASGTARTFA